MAISILHLSYFYLDFYLTFTQVCMLWIFVSVKTAYQPIIDLAQRVFEATCISVECRMAFFSECYCNLT